MAYFRGPFLRHLCNLLKIGLPLDSLFFLSLIPLPTLDCRFFISVLILSKGKLGIHENGIAKERRK